MPFVPGELIAGKYEVIDLLGVGGVGFVVSANHVELGEKVALKFLRPEMLVRQEVVARFAQEALASVRIKNEHVARVFDVGTLPNGFPFIVMEYLEGRDLYDLVVSNGAQPVKRAVDYVLQACEALADAHACGIVHRDIKPENLFLIQRAGGIEQVKVLDFGISKVALTGSALKSKVPFVRTMLPMGSPVYMSPEQIRASKNIDARTDIWSMGCVLHELLTGKAAFDAPSLTQLTATILEEQPPKVSDLTALVPPELDAIVSRCLEKLPENRYQNMAQLALALYPYGPRRARHSAERCCMLLKVDGASHAEFELPSIRPPSWDGLPSGAYVTTKTSPSGSFVSTPEIVDFPDFRKKSKTRRVATWLGIAGGLVATIAVSFGVFSGANESTLPSAVGSVALSAKSIPATPALRTAGPPASTTGSPHASAATQPSPTNSSAALVSSGRVEGLTPVVRTPQSVYQRAKTPDKANVKGAGARIISPANADPDPGF
jgi:serine/threonine-protein kinase